jgi:hypothetical protein
MFTEFHDYLLTNERTTPTVYKLLNLDFVHKTNLNEIWKIPKGQVPIGLPYKVIGILPKF